MKKGISTVLIIALAISCFTFAGGAVETAEMYDREIQMLIELDIMKPEQESGRFWSDAYVSRGQLADIAVKLLRLDVYDDYAGGISDVSLTHSYAKQIISAVNSGVMNVDSNNRFRPNDNASVSDAARVLVKATGYDVLVRTGTDTDFISVARSAGLVSARNENYLTRGSLAGMIYKALNTEVLQQTVYGFDTRFDTIQGETLLWKMMKIIRGSGVVKNNDLTSLSGMHEYSLKTSIKIGDNVFVCTTSNYRQYLGQYVEFYYNEDDEIVFLFPLNNKNEKIRIKSHEVIKEKVARDKIYYYSENGIREEYIEISPIADYIYNGMTLPGCDLDYIRFLDNNEQLEGYLICVDNNNDGLYDVVFINAFKSDVVEAVSEYQDKLHLKYSGYPISLDYQNDIKLETVIYKGNKEVTVSDISKNDTILYAYSKGNSLSVIATIYVSSKKFSSSVSEITYTYENVIDSISIGGVEYKASPQLNNFIQQGVLNTITAGDSATFFVNEFETVTAFDTSIRGDFAFAVAMEAVNDLSKAVNIKLLTQNGEMKIYKLANKVKYNESLINAQDVYHADLILGQTEYGKISNNPVRFTLNSEGAVNEISTASAPRDKDRFSLDLDGSMECRASAYLINGLYQIKKTAVVMLVPTAYSSDNKSYTLQSYEWFFINGNYNTGEKDANGFYDSGATVKFYDINDDYTVENIVVYYNEAYKNSYAFKGDTFSLVHRKINALNEEGEQKIKLSLYMGDGRVEEFLVNDTVDTDSVNRGDIVSYQLNEKREIYTLNRAFDSSNSAFLTTVTLGFSNMVYNLKIDRVFSDRLIATNGISERLILKNNRPVYYFNKSTGNIRIGDYSEISKDDIVACVIYGLESVRITVVYE